MATYFMFGKYSAAAIKNMSAKRTQKALKLIKSCKGKVSSMYALMGDRDLVLITDFPDIKQAIKASVGLTRMTGIGFTTSPALTIKEFDKIIKK